MTGYKISQPIADQKYRKLTLLMLDCWQREYDKRPYRHFKFNRITLEQRLDRNYDPKDDFSVIVLFLTKRILCSVKLKGFRIVNDNISLIDDFVRSLRNLQYIELLCMDLPIEFFQLLAFTATTMRVKELSLRGTFLSSDDILHLHCFLIKSKTLKKFNVASCNINQYTFAQLADGIYNSCSLNSCNVSQVFSRHLSLESDKIAHVISSLIWQNKLQELVLENCGFLGQDMEIIAEHLSQKHSKLQLLNLSYNKIGANGALELLKAISSSGTLKHLRINGCSLQTHGGELVSHYLSSCWNLQSLQIQHNNIDAEAVNAILLCLKKSCKLQQLYLLGNRFDKATGTSLRRLLVSGVLPQDSLDVTATYDDTIECYRVVPCFI